MTNARRPLTTAEVATINHLVQMEQNVPFEAVEAHFKKRMKDARLENYTGLVKLTPGKLPEKASIFDLYK